MSLSEEYRQQFGWRSWKAIFDALPAVTGQTVLDLGCAIGDQAAELVGRGAYVIGFDANEELLEQAKLRGLANAEFHKTNLRTLPKLGQAADGLWCSFTAAYFPDLADVLASWEKSLRSGGWIALTEIDDLFAHAPLDNRTKLLLDDFVKEALDTNRYDFCMGRRLADQLEHTGFNILKQLIIEDREFAFQGPAQPAVLDAWRMRFERMKVLHDFCGAEFAKVRDEFLHCLTRDDHWSATQVHSCIAIKQA